jgi:hypothetical protein
MPNPNVHVAIHHEHVYSADSSEPFLLNDVYYTPAEEYEFVTNPKPFKFYPAMGGENGRVFQELNFYLSHPNVKLCSLQAEEIIALRLYTGPMFWKYNAVLRKFPKDVVEGLRGNGYTTTIHAIVSGIVKLSQIMKLPPGRKVRCLF